MSRIAILTVIVFATAMAAGCGRRGEVRCEDPERYSTSDSIPPVRVPEDLSLPNETESLVIPPGARTTQSASETECLETPPDFFEDNPDEGA